MNQTANNVSRGNPANQRRIISSLLIGFALLILIVVLLRRFLEPYVGSLSGTAKWSSQALIVGTAIYALFVPPYDKKRRRLSRAGFVTIFSFLIAFGAFALSDWKDRVDARKAGDDRTEQIKKLKDINDSQQRTLIAQDEALTGIRKVSTQQTATSNQLTEQAKAQDQLVKDAQNLLAGQGVQLERQAQTLSEVGRAQEPLGQVGASPEIFIPYDSPMLRPWLDRLNSFMPFPGGKELEAFIRDTNLQPRADLSDERSVAKLLMPGLGTVSGAIYLRFYAKGKTPERFLRWNGKSRSDLSIAVNGAAKLYFVSLQAKTSDGRESTLREIAGNLDAGTKVIIPKQTRDMNSIRDFGGATVIADLQIDNDTASAFQLSRVFISSQISSQRRILNIEGFVPIRGQRGSFEAKIPSPAVWQ